MKLKNIRMFGEYVIKENGEYCNDIFHEFRRNQIVQCIGIEIDTFSDVVIKCTDGDLTQYVSPKRLRKIK